MGKITPVKLLDGPARGCGWPREGLSWGSRVPRAAGSSVHLGLWARVGTWGCGVRQRAPARRSAPPGCHEEANQHDAKTNEDVPLAETLDRPHRTTDVKDNDPEQSQEHEPKHHRLKPHRIRRRLAAHSLDGFGSYRFATCHAPILAEAPACTDRGTSNEA